MGVGIDLYELGSFAIGLLAVLIAIAGDWLVKVIGSALGSVHIGPFSFNIGDKFIAIGGDVINWAIGIGQEYWGTIANWFHGLAFISTTLFEAAIQEASHLGDQIAHLYNVSVPNALDAANGYAREMRNEAEQVIEDDIAGVWREASGHFTAGARSAWEHNAAVFGDLESNVLGAISVGVDDAENFAATEIGNLRAYVDNQITSARNDATKALNATATAIATQIANLANVVNDDYAKAIAEAQNDAAAALATATGLVNAAKTEAENVALADANTVQNLLQQALDTTNSAVSSLTTTVGQDFTAAEQQARAEVAQGVATVTGALNTAIGTVNQSISAAASAAAAGIQGAITDAQNDANTALGDATDALGQALAGVTSDLTGKAISFGGDLSGIEGLLAGAIAAGVAAVAARVTHLEECAVTVCDGPNMLSTLLDAAIGTATFAMLADFLKNAIDNPAGAEAGYAALVAPMFQSGESLLNTLLTL